MSDHQNLELVAFFVLSLIITSLIINADVYTSQGLHVHYITRYEASNNNDNDEDEDDDNDGIEDYTAEKVILFELSFTTQGSS